MKGTIESTTKTTFTTLLRGSLVILALATAGGCGQKGPLVLEQVPIDQTQAPLENSIDPIPVEATAEAVSEPTDDTVAKPE